MRLLNKCLKTIVIRVAVNESPLNLLPATVQKYTRSENATSKRRLNLQENNTENVSSVQPTQVHVTKASSVNNHINNTNIINSSEDGHVVLPLERHALRYEQIVESLYE